MLVQLGKASQGTGGGRLLLHIWFLCKKPREPGPSPAHTIIPWVSLGPPHPLAKQ